MSSPELTDALRSRTCTSIGSNRSTWRTIQSLVTARSLSSFWSIRHKRCFLPPTWHRSRANGSEAMCDAGGNFAFAKLPIELLKMISNENDVAMTRLEAEKYREELMSERDMSVKGNNRAYFGAVGYRLWGQYGD